MTDTILQLGPLLFQDLATPPEISYGGAQTLVVHRLPGGARVIDAMGRDDAEISFAGIFAGADATLNARALDALRAAGGMLSLSWDVFVYSVLIREATLDFRAPWFIPFRVVCTVLQDEAAALVSTALSLGASLLADAAAATGAAADSGLDLSAVTAAFNQPNVASPGGAEYRRAVSALAGAQGQAAFGIDSATATLSAPLTSAVGFPSIVQSAGTLASLVTAQAYLGRASANLVNAST
jgi:hypothetical protein